MRAVRKHLTSVLRVLLARAATHPAPLRRASALALPLLVCAALAGLTCGAMAQSSPGLQYGQVPPAAQWNSYFAAKQDVLGYTPLNKAGDSMQGTLVTQAPTTTSVGLVLPPGNAPGAPPNGALWTTSQGLFAEIGSQAVGPFAASSLNSVNRLFLSRSDSTPYNELLQFGSLAAVQAWYGTSSAEATLATGYFSGYTGNAAQMLFTRFPSAGARARLYSSRLPSLATLQAITAGSLSVSVDGGTLSTNTLNLSGDSSYAAVATTIATALNASPPTLGTWPNSTIAPITTTFTGYFTSAYLYVTSVPTGPIYGGMQLTDLTGDIAAAVAGNFEGLVVNNLLSGNPASCSTGSPCVYGLNLPVGWIASEAVTGSAGLLTIGSGGSGIVAEGDVVTGAGVSSQNAIQRNISGSGVGSTWVVGIGDTVGPETLSVVPNSIVVNYTTQAGATGSSINANNLWFVPSAAYNPTSNGSTMSFAAGSAAATLGLTQLAGATLVPLGTDTPLQSPFMNNVVNTLGANFATFQSMVNLDYYASSGETTQANLFATWAANAGGQYTFLPFYSTTTPTIGIFYSDAQMVSPMVLTNLSIQATLPNKSLVVSSAGDFQIWNNGNTAAILDLTDSGKLTLGASATINSSTGGLLNPSTLGVQGVDAANMLIGGYASAAIASVAMGRVDGTFNAPTALVANDVIGNYEFGGWDGTAFHTARAVVRGVATGNWVNGSDYETELQFYSTPPSSTTLGLEATFQNGVALGALSSKGVGTINVNAYIAGGSSPTLTTGSCSGSAATGGSLAGKFTAPSCVAGTIILSALPTAPNGYACGAQDQTTPSDTLKQTANTANSVTFAATTAVSDVIVFQCLAF